MVSCSGDEMPFGTKVERLDLETTKFKTDKDAMLQKLKGIWIGDNVVLHVTDNGVFVATSRDDSPYADYTTITIKDKDFRDNVHDQGVFIGGWGKTTAVFDTRGEDMNYTIIVYSDTLTDRQDVNDGILFTFISATDAEKAKGESKTYKAHLYKR